MTSKCVERPTWRATASPLIVSVANTATAPNDFIPTFVKYISTIVSSIAILVSIITTGYIVYSVDKIEDIYDVLLGVCATT